MRPLILTLLIVSAASALAQSSFNITQVSHLTYQNDNNDIWGYTDPNSGKEYALVGTTAGVSIVDVSTPATPVKKQFVQGPYSIWRDLKTWSHYAFVTHDNTFAWNTLPDHGILIIDMDSVENPTPTWKNVNLPVLMPSGGWDTLRTAHNLYIDENGYCYLFGSNIATGGALILDVVTDPWNPTVAGIYNDYYFHDGMVRGDTLWGSAIYAGKFVVVDVTQKDSAFTLATHGTPNSFTHNTWVSDNNKVLFCTDEVGAAYVSAYDVTDLSNITELDRIQTSFGTTVIPHNAHVYGQWVVTSYYTSGVQIVDAKYPELLVEVGYFDTSPGFSGGGYYGNWGAYPYFESGLLVCSDIEEGLWVLEPDYVEASRVHIEVYDSITKAPLSNVSINFTLSQLSGSSSIDGLLNLGTPLQTVDTVNAVLSGYVPFSGTYNWQLGQFDTLRIPLLNVNNVGLEEEHYPIVVYPNPSNGNFRLTGMESGTYTVVDLSGRKIAEGEISDEQVSLPAFIPSGHYSLITYSDLGLKTFSLVLIP